MRKQIMYEVFDRKFNLKVVIFQLQSMEFFSFTSGFVLVNLIKL